MLRKEFEDFDAVGDAAYKACEEFLNSPAAAAIRGAMQEMSSKYPHFSVSLNCMVEVFDEKRKETLPILRMGIVSSEGKPAYQHWADSSPQRYWANGEVCVVPHDHCPICWGEWDFKYLHKHCQSCDATLGKQVKYMLDDDHCPHCANGKVTPKAPKCAECGFEVREGETLWG